MKLGSRSIGRRLHRLAWGAALAAGVSAATPSHSTAARYTPARWAQPVQSHADSVFLGQRKHVGWIRDRNQNFIDDLIERRFRKTDSVDVIVELNECLPKERILEALAPYGRVTYLGRVVSSAFMRRVPRRNLDSLARLPEVAMVEWQTPFRSALGISTRAVQAVESKGSGGYGAGNAARLGDGSGWTGEGVNIAIVDTGVDDTYESVDGGMSLIGSAFVAGFDATDYEDTDADGFDDSTAGTSPCLPGTVCGKLEEVNVDPSPGHDAPEKEHGTIVASVAMGRAPPDAAGHDCRTPSSESPDPGTDCSGVAPGAGLIDVRVCLDNNDCGFAAPSDPDVMQGIDWVALNRDRHSIDVANFSISNYEDCDGNCTICMAVNYLAALGIVPVAALGNDTAERETPTRRVGCPAAAVNAITVGATDDKDSISRADDWLYSKSYAGPRKQYEGLDLSTTGDKPDISAPGTGVNALNSQDSFYPASGTSVAAPHVAGAAALLIQAMRAPAASSPIPPADVKYLLLEAADDMMNGSEDGTPLAEAERPRWDARFGHGMLDVYEAFRATRVTDLAFPTCSGDADDPGTPCPLEGGLRTWQNWEDLLVTGDLVWGSEITISARVENRGTAPAENFYVTFGIYDFGTGTKLFHEIGTVYVERLEDGKTETYSTTHVLTASEHQCLSVTIHYGLDSNALNNTTQRNLEVAASRYEMRVESPFMVPAEFYVRPSSERTGWPCKVDQTEFRIGGSDDCARLVRIDFHAPKGSQPGDRANCNVEVFARPVGSEKPKSIGGVTVQTYVPHTCRVIGQVVNPTGKPLKDVRLTFERVIPPGILRASWDRIRRARSDRDGVFDIDAMPDMLQAVTLQQRGRTLGTVQLRPRCGLGSLILEAGSDGVRLRR